MSSRWQTILANVGAIAALVWEWWTTPKNGPPKPPKEPQR